jgi:hemoglobin
MTTRRVAGWLGMLAVAGVALGACATGGGAPDASLYKRLGGRHGIAVVVDDFVANLAADSRVNARFKDLPAPAVSRLKSNLSDQICEATGGPCSYVGRDMKTVHTGMKITDAEWNATVENLTKAMTKHNVGANDQRAVIGILAPMKQDIVGR